MAINSYIVDNQLLFIVQSSQLPDTHLDEILEGGVHVDVLVLQLAVAGPKFCLLHKPEDSDKGRDGEEGGEGEKNQGWYLSSYSETLNINLRLKTLLSQSRTFMKPSIQTSSKKNDCCYWKL